MVAGNVYPGASPPLNAERLSDWLQRQSPVENAYLSGLSWLVPAELPAQALMQSALKSHLIGSEWTYRAELKARQRLSAWISGLPVTGRVPVEQSDPRWLEAHPAQNPVLAPDHRVVVPPRPGSVTVVTSDGSLCITPHTPGHEALAYIAACKGSLHSRHVERVWIAQPDGRAQTFGVAGWNVQAQGEPAPGAWIWGPSRDSGWSDGFGKILIEFLATQGPSADANAEMGTKTATAASASPSDFSYKFTAPAPQGSKAPSRDAVLSGNDWGGIGLLQNPSGRMAKAGAFSTNFSRAYPYSRLNVTMQPLDWMELSYRYISISEVLYGPKSLSGDQSYKDKSVDLKIRVLKESFWLPEVSVGARDIGGTGLFSGEYVAASKRAGDFDWTLGLGWGSLGSKGTLPNPLSFISNKFNIRGAAVAGGGRFGVGSFFRGRTAFFGGLEYQTGWAPLTLKLEYDGNNYNFTRDQFNIPAPKSSFNIGAVYRYTPSIDFTFGVQRGSVATLGVAIHYPFNRLATPKIDDPALPRFVPERPVVANWSTTITDLKAQTGWRVAEIRKQGSVLQIELTNADAIYWRNMVDRAAAILHRDAPADIDEFHFIYKTRGVAMANHVVNRERWGITKTQPLPPSALITQRYSLLNYTDTDGDKKKSTAASVPVLRPKYSPLTGDIGYSLQQSLGGPDGFVLYQVRLDGISEWHLTPNTWLSSAVSVRAFDNYKKFRYSGSSRLPRVRTLIREYVTTSRVTMSNLQLTHAGQLSRNQYYSIYGGYLESMYAGVGAEWLYRPLSGPLALGVDINSVKQRDFDQKFGLRDYRAITGHATAYIETGWNGVIAKVSVGQYLAKDRGITLDVSRRFSNGVVFGAFATKTNVSAAQFGEGSFDKGIYFSIPLDTLFTRSTPEISVFNWNPLTRDGGAKLRRGFPLYNMTNLRDLRTLTITPPDDS